MNNLDVLATAVQLMKAHNFTGNYEVFHDIKMDPVEESISFDLMTQFIGTADMICTLLNLTLHIEVNSDPSSDKTLNFYIN